MAEQRILTYLGPIIFVRDIEVAAAFYTQVLGFEVEIDFGENVGLRGGLALWQLGPERIIRQRLGDEAIADRRANRFELSFETDDIAALRERVLSGGGELLHDIHEEPWGQRVLRFLRSRPAPHRGRRAHVPGRAAAARPGPHPGRSGPQNGYAPGPDRAIVGGLGGV